MTSHDPLRTRAAVAVAAVRRATKLCQAVQRRLVSPETIQKKDRSPVTVADFASQAVICAMLGEAFPDDPVVGEENAGVLRDPAQAAVRDVVVEQVCAAMGCALGADQVARYIDRGGLDPTRDTERFWTVDPIDGTKGFLRDEHYVVALALIERGEVTLGVLGCPRIEHAGGPGAVMLAIKGRGATLLPLDGGDEGDITGERVHVSDVADTSRARFCESVESGHSDQSASQAIAAELKITAPPLRMDSQAKYAAVARGDATIYMRLPTRADYREKIWDHAAGMIVVQEAGGRVTDVHGKPLDFTHGRSLAANAGIIATNGRVHDAVVRAVKRHVS